MKRFLYKRAFLKAFDSCSDAEKGLVIKADRSRNMPFGLRVKRLFEKGGEKTYEARVSDKVRILFVESEELVAYAFLGNHEQVRRYIKSFK